MVYADGVFGFHVNKSRKSLFKVSHTRPIVSKHPGHCYYELSGPEIEAEKDGKNSHQEDIE